MDIVEGNELDDLSSNLVYISNRANTIANGMKPTILPPDKGKIFEQTHF